ncbi:patatin-like phospholipase family protein [Babesia bovis T2Bo]|uniref:Patatin-like phospholipase family protein n=1 Tax=Babesia bovis TaxID=5865 RepID=A7AM34_BABBO|nr:patatin-like phospholipase family protein [Babesia bovis T2Bo]EDO07618.1 patatin-like phospholipase family protein [Babesia bovis T2Bo]|eukprot:XP_001611186.1 patatin-like phospholipase family protein [Babesia bovis T2Bo]
MWTFWSTKWFVLSLTLFGMWIRWQPLQGSLLYPCFVVATEHHGAASFVTSRQHFRRTSLKEGVTSVSPLEYNYNRGRRHTIGGNVESEDISFRDFATAELDLPILEEVYQPSFKDLLIPDNEDIVIHISELLLQFSALTDSPKRYVAVNALRLLVQNRPECLKTLKDMNGVNALVDLLQRRYQSGIWNRISGYIRSRSSMITYPIKLMEANILVILLEAVKRDAELRQVISQNKSLMSHLCNLFVFGDKHTEAPTSPVQGPAPQETASLQDVKVSESTSTSSGSCASYNGNSNAKVAPPSPPSHTSSISRESANADAVNAWTTKSLIRQLIANMDVTNDEDTRNQLNKMRSTPGADKNAITELKNIVIRAAADTRARANAAASGSSGAPSTSPDAKDNQSPGAVSPSATEGNQEVSKPVVTTATPSKPDGPFAAFAKLVDHKHYGINRGGKSAKVEKKVDNGPRLLWIPYCISKTENLQDAIRRNLRISLGDHVASNIVVDGLNDLTLERSGKIHPDLVYGMLLLCRPSPASGINSCLPTISFSSDSRRKVPIERDHGAYMVVSNLELVESKYLNGLMLVKKLLNQLSIATRLVEIDDILKELWTLIGAKNKDMLDFLYEHFDLKYLAKLIVIADKYAQIGDLAAKDKDSDPLKSLKETMTTISDFFEKTFDKATNINWKDLFQSPFAKKDEYETGSLTNIKNHETTDVKLTNHKYKLALEAIENGNVSRSIQTTICGMLIDMVYFDGVRTLAAIRRCDELVASLKAMRNKLPKPMKIADVLGGEDKRYVPVIDRLGVVSKTKLIRNPARYKDARYMEELAHHQIDDYGTVLVSVGDWTKKAWSRQPVVPSNVIGPFFNGNKLLNMIGEHEQNRFKNRGLRVLSIDGGGSKGVIVLEILLDLEKRLGRPLYEVFDVIVGNSCGGIIGAFLALEKSRVTDVQRYFDAMLGDVFKKEGYGSKGKRLFTHLAYYNEQTLYDALTAAFGNLELIDYSVDPDAPKFCCLSVQLDIYPFKPVLWRSYNYPPNAESKKNSPRIIDGTFAVKTPDALRATSAAPTYFPMMEINGALYADGALYANNPSAIAVIESKLLYPDVPIDLLVSISNGDWNDMFSLDAATAAAAGIDIAPSDTESKDNNTTERVPPLDKIYNDIVLRSGMTCPRATQKTVGLDKLLKHIIFSATNTEMVHLSLHAVMGDHYVRINPSMPLVELDVVVPEVLQDLKDRTKEFLKQEDTIEVMDRIAKVLSSKTSPEQAKGPAEDNDK